MIKSFFTLFVLLISLNAYEIEDKENHFTVKIKDISFNELYLNLKD